MRMGMAMCLWPQIRTSAVTFFWQARRGRPRALDGGRPSKVTPPLASHMATVFRMDCSVTSAPSGLAPSCWISSNEEPER